ncbi:hypothetical protein ABK040_004397 [Willaertia magna]
MIQNQHFPEYCHQDSIEITDEKHNTTLHVKKSEFLNPKLLEVLENKICTLSESFNHLLGSLQSSMLAKSSITLEHMQVYQQASNNLCNQVNESITNMEIFQNKFSELDAELKNMRELYHQIKELRKLVEIIYQSTTH